MNCIPSVKDSVSYLFDYYLGIKLNLSNLSLDNNNNLFIQLTNINIEPSRINLNYLKDINIKLTKGLIEKLELRIGVSTFEIKISKLSVMLMPIIVLNQNEKKEESVMKLLEEEKEKEKENNENNNDQNNKNKTGIISSFVNNYLSKLKISIEEIELIAFNYEITNKNLTYSNPVISFNIYNINYDKGKMDEKNNEAYIRQNIWENKHFSIGAICVKISKIYKNDKEGNSNIDFQKTNKLKDKDSDSVGEDNKKKELFEKDNNDNILLINTDKGIHFYTNTQNEISGDIGDIQLIINLFQLELLKNFIDTYSLYLSDNYDNKKSGKTKKNKKNENITPNIDKNDIIKQSLNQSVNSSSVIYQSNNEVMNAKIILNSFSIVLLERNQNPTEVKLYEFNKDKMQEHFCYFEDNFFIFILSNFSFEYNNKKKLTSLKTEEIIFNYIEYNNKTKKEEEVELITRTGSEYSECNGSLILRGGDMFRSMGEDDNTMFDVKKYYCSYDYNYHKNQILLVKSFNVGYNFVVKDKKKINLDLNSFNLNFHPIFLFKMLKILYENSFLINEVLFFNKDHEKKNKNEENNKDIDSNAHKQEENKEKLNISFLSCDESEDEEEGEDNKKNKNEDIKKEDNNIKENNNTKKENNMKEDKKSSNEITNINIKKEEEKENIIYSSELFLRKESDDEINNNNNEPKEEINDQIKKILKTLNIEVVIKAIEIRIYSFKCEENFYNIINPFFNEFYYDHIYIMDIKDDFRQKKLKIAEVTSSDYFNIMIKYLSFKNVKDEKNNKSEELVLKFNTMNSSFTNNKLVEIQSDTYPVRYILDENKISLDLKINVIFVIKLMVYMLSFVNIWKYTMLIFDIFKQRMMFNYDKGKESLAQMNFEEDILKHFEQIKTKNKTIEKNNDININKSNGNDNDKKFSIEVKIKAIKLYLEIIKQKIKSLTVIENVNLNYMMTNDKQNIEFSIDKIESKEFKSLINDIKLNLNISKKIDKNSVNIKNSANNPKKKKNINLMLNNIVPEESIEMFLETFIRLKNRLQQINNENEATLNKKVKTITNINISIQNIQVEPLESILYFNDIYNVIMKEEILINNNNSKNQILLDKSLRSMSISSRTSKKSFKNNLGDSLNEQKAQKSILSNFGSEEPLLVINFNISSTKAIIRDETNHRQLELIVNNLNLKNANLSFKNIEFLIYYETKEFSDKVKVNLGYINNISLNIIEKIDFKISYHIIIEEIFFSFCKDSFFYIENVMENISKIMSNCFVQAKKSNKIVISKKKNNLISTYDLDENQDDQESQLFGNNVATSICLVPNKNEFVLEIDHDYLDNYKDEKEEPVEIMNASYKITLKEKIQNKKESDLSLTINKISIGLYSGNDFESTLDIKTTSISEFEKEKEKKKANKDNSGNNNEDENTVNEIDSKLESLQKSLIIKKKDEKNEQNLKNKDSDNFEIIECDPYNKINARENDDYLLFSVEHLNLSILYEKADSYEIEFTINDFEIKDNLKESNFKRLLGARKNIENDELKQRTSFLSIFVDISNSQNELSTNNYSDFNIACEISLASIQLMVHQNSLLFILNYFLNDETQNKVNPKNELKLYYINQYHTKPSYVLDSVFNQIVVEDYGEEHNELIEDKTFLYITNFLFREFSIHITYESNDLGFKFKSIYIPLVPGLNNYNFCFNKITYKGFVTINEFTDFYVKHLMGQLSKYKIVLDLLTSLSWTQPIVNIFGDFFDIFISPFQSYRKNQGFMNGLFKGLKKFFFNLLSKNVYAGEKLIRTLTTFIGVTKNNNIGKNSFYEKYILTDEKKRIYDYFYK